MCTLNTDWHNRVIQQAVLKPYQSIETIRYYGVALLLSDFIARAMKNKQDLDVNAKRQMKILKLKESLILLRLQAGTFVPVAIEHHTLQQRIENAMKIQAF